MKRAQFIASSGELCARRISLSMFTTILLCALSAQLSAQNTIGGSGNWDNTGIWSSANIADNVNENVAFSGGADKTATVRSGFNYTVGNIDLDKHALSIVGILNVGDAANARDITTSSSSSPTISVSGTLIIWGNLVVNNNLTLTISGTVIIKGDVIMGNGASLTVSGGLQIDGDLTGGNNTQVVNSGNINVGGAVTVGGGTTSLVNSGTFTAGSCSGPTGFCNNVTLPVTLLFLSAKTYPAYVQLTWATATELNFDRFIIEKTIDGKSFYEIGTLKGAGLSNSRRDYSFKDTTPTIGRAYYRLKAVDYDGYFDYFGLVMVDFTGNKMVVVHPNPVDGDEVNVHLNFSPSENTWIIIYDQIGVELDRRKVSAFDEHFVLTEAYRPGSYIAKVIDGSEQFLSRFIVR